MFVFGEVQLYWTKHLNCLKNTQVRKSNRGPSILQMN